jgi:surface polysaccharide O-acyltransferase-like enzyme
MNLIHFVPLWREVVYGLAGAGMITALVLLLGRQRIGVPLFVVAVILERFDWAFHGFVSSTPETWFGYIELVLMVLAGTSVVVAMPLINWRQRQTDR